MNLPPIEPEVFARMQRAHGEAWRAFCRAYPGHRAPEVFAVFLTGWLAKAGLWVQYRKTPK